MPEVTPLQTARQGYRAALKRFTKAESNMKLADIEYIAARTDYLDKKAVMDALLLGDTE